MRRKFLALSAAMLSVVGLKGNAIAATSASEVPESSIVSDTLTSAEWVAYALSASGYRADFTLESLGEIDRFFDDHARGGVVRPDGLLSEQFGSRIFAIGAYVGETLRRQLDGEWIGDDKDPEAEINISLKLGDGSIIWPVQRAMKRFRNGPEDSIAAYGSALSGVSR